MTFAIQHCLLYPDRAPGVDATTDFSKALQLDFKAPDIARFPCLQLAYDVMRTSGSAPAIFNAANEIAVERFLAHELAYLDIPHVIEHTLSLVNAAPATNLEALLQVDAEARNVASSFTSTAR
jgi:1-deoxy-D-xylulose-5-phosphate reductoisomerase